MPRSVLARCVSERRVELGLTQAELAREAEISVSAVQKLEDPKSTIARPRSLPKVEKALSWPRGTGDAILRGEEPPPASQPTEASEESVPLPVGQGIDPEFLVELATASPEQLQRVRDFLKGIKEGR
ncbi:helix-turn-helix domain-containing protein [Streptomyces boncukensis]|nr:helix-turn-helix transcriptional regulator [Streptomyces boncukensis]